MWLKSKRISEIGEYVLSKKTVSYDELCEHFGVSKNTMRRDIEELVGRGLLEKAYGGVVAAQASKVLPQSYRETRAFGESA
jgi:DeoR family myo-inositol catabolism operon transcriptional repressor